jgi:hypothetical protein
MKTYPLWTVLVQLCQAAELPLGIDVAGVSHDLYPMVIDPSLTGLST